MAAVVHAQRADVIRRRCDGSERDQRPFLRAEIQQLERGWITLVFRKQLEDHPILIVGRVDRRDLARAVRVVQRLLDLLHRHAQGGGAVAVDPHAHLRVLDLQIGCHVLQRGDAAQHPLEVRGVVVQRVDVGALQGELVLGLGRAPPDTDRRRDL